MENKTNKVASHGEGGGGIMGYKVQLNAELCSNCGECVIRCPKRVFKIVKGIVLIDANLVTSCNGCDECGKICETNAIVVSYPQA